MTAPNKINFPPPKLQIDFAFALKRFRAVYLQSALLETVRDMDIAELDKQLAEYVPPADLATLAQYGLRAELLFAVPAVLEANPYLSWREGQSVKPRILVLEVRDKERPEDKALGWVLVEREEAYRRDPRDGTIYEASIRLSYQRITAKFSHRDGGKGRFDGSYSRNFNSVMRHL